LTDEADCVDFVQKIVEGDFGRDEAFVMLLLLFMLRSSSLTVSIRHVLRVIQCGMIGLAPVNADGEVTVLMIRRGGVASVMMTLLVYLVADLLSDILKLLHGLFVWLGWGPFGLAFLVVAVLRLVWMAFGTG
jgi:hypothetical protein